MNHIVISLINFCEVHQNQDQLKCEKKRIGACQRKLPLYSAVCTVFTKDSRRGDLDLKIWGGGPLLLYN